MHILETVPVARAKVRIHQERPYDYDEKTGLWLYRQVGEDAYGENIITNTGRVQMHTFVYGTSPRSNGLNWIGLSNDATPPAVSDTSLAAEITGNGLSRAQGTVVLPTGSGNQTTISKVFTYTGGSPQGVQKCALFDTAGPPIAGVINHEILFVQRTLFTNDTLTVSYTITLA